MASNQEAKAFINQIAPIIQRLAQKNGYKVASPIIAQACIESNWGLSSLGKRYHNYFGMKCGSNWRGKSVNLSTKEEYTVGQLTNIKANFRAYDSMEEGVQGYFDFIGTKRYANLKLATSAQQYLEYIKNDGYATSSTYVNTNMNVVRKWSLTEWDNFNSVTDTGTNRPTLKIGSKGDDVMYLQDRLNYLGYDCGTADGIFGIKTDTAVKYFQTRNALKSDGIVGKLTWAKLLA